MHLFPMGHHGALRSVLQGLRREVHTERAWLPQEDRQRGQPRVLLGLSGDELVTQTMSVVEFNRRQIKKVSEAQLSSQLDELRNLAGWDLSYHTYDSRRSPYGFPDVVLTKVPRVVFAELKTETGQPTFEQWFWLWTLQQCPGVEAYLWRPSDMASGEIARILCP